MDNQRIFLWAGLAVLLFLNVQTWQHDYAPPVTAPTVAAATPPTTA